LRTTSKHWTNERSAELQGMVLDRHLGKITAEAKADVMGLAEAEVK